MINNLENRKNFQKHTLEEYLLLIELVQNIIELLLIQPLLVQILNFWGFVRVKLIEGKPDMRHKPNFCIVKSSAGLNIKFDLGQELRD